MHRFYLPTLGTENHLWLTGKEADHLRRVLRLKPGDQLAVFDGSGIECQARIEQSEKHRVKLEILSRYEVYRDPATPVTLACAIVKSKAMNQVIDHCAELGVREIIPVETERTVRNVAKREAKHLRRWRRLAAEASKQSGRTTLTHIAAPRPLDELLVKAGRWDLALAFAVHQNTLPLRTVLAEHPAPSSVLYLIGPEGGFEDEEVKRIARADFQLVRLGPSTLRTQVAATAALAAILYHYER